MSDEDKAKGEPVAGPSRNSRTARLPLQAVDAVGRKLKASYDQMLREPIPDKFMELLERLERGPDCEEEKDDGPKGQGTTADKDGE